MLIFNSNDNSLLLTAIYLHLLSLPHSLLLLWAVPHHTLAFWLHHLVLTGLRLRLRHRLILLLYLLPSNGIPTFPSLIPLQRRILLSLLFLAPLHLLGYLLLLHLGCLLLLPFPIHTLVLLFIPLHKLHLEYLHRLRIEVGEPHHQRRPLLLHTHLVLLRGILLHFLLLILHLRRHSLLLILSSIACLFLLLGLILLTLLYLALPLHFIVWLQLLLLGYPRKLFNTIEHYLGAQWFREAEYSRRYRGDRQRLARKLLTVTRALIFLVMVVLDAIFQRGCHLDGLIDTVEKELWLIFLAL